MTSVTVWTRLEPHPRDGSMQRSLQAQVRDPLWLLARQWQLGELHIRGYRADAVARRRGVELPRHL